MFRIKVGSAGLDTNCVGIALIFIIMIAAKME
jgi:hypothetical protein